jgi:hypothetical protein
MVGALRQLGCNARQPRGDATLEQEGAHRALI